MASAVSSTNIALRPTTDESQSWLRKPGHQRCPFSGLDAYPGSSRAGRADCVKNQVPMRHTRPSRFPNFVQHWTKSKPFRQPYNGNSKISH